MVLLGDRQLSAHHAGRRQPKQHLLIFGRVSERFAKHPRPGKFVHRTASGGPFGGDEAGPDRHDEIQFRPIPVRPGWQSFQRIDAVL